VVNELTATTNKADQAADAWEASEDLVVGSISEVLVELLGALSNREMQGRLEQLADRLDRLAASNASPRPSGRVDQQMRPGVVMQAVIGVLAAADRPMRTRDVYQAVVTQLQQAVGYGTVEDVPTGVGLRWWPSGESFRR
jgi:hypothetical protein